MNNLFKQNSSHQNVKITKKLLVHHWCPFRVKLLYITSFCFNDFDPRPETLVRSLQCRLDSGLERCPVGMSLTCWSLVQWRSTCNSSDSNLDYSEARILWIKTFSYYPTVNFEPRRAFVELLSHRIWRSSSVIRRIVVLLTPKIFANFVRDSLGSLEMSSWALSIVESLLTFLSNDSSSSD